MPKRFKSSAFPKLPKTPTGIIGFDEITEGGVPRGRPTLVCGSAGSGKSLFAAEFLVRGATQYGEAGVLMTFEETVDDITKNVASLGFDVTDLKAKKKLLIDHVQVNSNDIEENGEYDLGGLFIRVGVRHRHYRSSSRRARYDRNTFFRFQEPRNSSIRSKEAFRVAQGTRDDGDYYRGARRRPTYPGGT